MRCAQVIAGLRPYFTPLPSPLLCRRGAEESQPDSAADQQHHQHRLQQQEEKPTLKQDLQPSSFSLDTPVRFRGHYDLARNKRGRGARAGPLSVNDPQLDATDFATNLLRSENFLHLACPIRAGNSWKIQYRDATVHVHLLLRAMVAAQDFAGAARALATLHRVHCRFDPDVYRYTVSLLRLSGDHQVSALDVSSAGGCLTIVSPVSVESGLVVRTPAGNPNVR